MVVVMGASKFTSEVWETEIGPRYRDDRSLTGKQMAEQLGIHEVTLTSQMRRRGFCRNVTASTTTAAFRQGDDGPEMAPVTGADIGAVIVGAGTGAGAGAGAGVEAGAEAGARAARPRPADLLRFVFDPEAPVASIQSLARQARRAAADGRTHHFRDLMQSGLLMERFLARLRALAEETDEAEAAVRAVETAPPLELRSAQRPPEGDWSTWLFLGGRGAGKTLAGSAWLADQADRRRRLALVGATLHDVREVMIGGPSGLLSLPRWVGGERPVYEPSRRRLRFPNGAEAWVFSAEDPDSLRGPQFEAAWADEFCAWARPEETLAMLRLGLRLGEDPRLAVTTTPRPMAALKALRAEAGCVSTHAPTRENRDHLAPGFLDGLRALYGGTRREAQEIDGLVVEAEGALFRAEDLARARLGAGDRPAGFDRIVVAVDPTTTPGGDACGIVAAGRLGEVAYVLADRSMRGLTPDAWARRAIALLDEVGAGEIVAEVNQGGEMVTQTLRTARPGVKVRQVRATKGKRLRAEPVAALYEQGRVHHLGRFKDLEEELMALGGTDEGRLSLDRADALVWAVTDLMLGPRGEGPRLRWM